MKKVSEQLALPIELIQGITLSDLSYREKLVSLLTANLDFHNNQSNYGSHNFHSFPAKFPPQLPRRFIEGLTNPGDVVLDPMMGSGTTILETFFAHRQAIGFDIDPLALIIGKVKVTSLDLEKTDRVFHQVMWGAKENINNRRDYLETILSTRWDGSTKEFLDFWFAQETQLELIALLVEIENITEPAIQLFLMVAFSACIITKTGGVSLALDLAHTRPHRAKIVYSQDGREIIHEVGEKPPKHLEILTKTLRSPLTEFEKRYTNNLKGISPYSENIPTPVISWGDAQVLSLQDSSIDLIVTSPPYSSNAIDYMRAHKFSLVWFGYPIVDLSQKRQNYIGGDAISGINYEVLPNDVISAVQRVSDQDIKKGQSLHRYFSEMTRVLQEMFRVLKPGKAAIVVVGNSIIRGMDTQTHKCLASIGSKLGFDVPAIGIRNLDRNRRMLPAGITLNLESQIQQRMHEEYVIGFYKPTN
jgi:DNA modification methylase